MSTIQRWPKPASSDKTKLINVNFQIDFAATRSIVHEVNDLLISDELFENEPTVYILYSWNYIFRTYLPVINYHLQDSFFVIDNTMSSSNATVNLWLFKAFVFSLSPININKCSHIRNRVRGIFFLVDSLSFTWIWSNLTITRNHVFVFFRKQQLKN